MRRLLGVVVLMVAALPLTAAAQTAALTIHNVTVQASTGTLTIVGVGFGRAPVVTIDGQPAAVLLGGTDTQIDVEAPASVLTMPGTYRLTVVDPARQVGEAFIVASQTGEAILGAGNVSSADTPRAATPGALGRAGRVPDIGRLSHADGSVSPTLIENGCNTAVGVLALTSGPPSGCRNTAIGVEALRFDTSGEDNTATGHAALYANTTGSYNTASGSYALVVNSSGEYNTALGRAALSANTSGSSNTASGFNALYSNVTGFFNTASGAQALLENTTGSENTATGAYALQANVTGHSNSAHGYRALNANTEGYSNVATGFEALADNVTGHNNTGTGTVALRANTTGYWNVAMGAGALYRNTEGFWNTASGTEALHENLTGYGNTAVGVGALYANSFGSNNTALGMNAGNDTSAGSWNVFIGALVEGEAGDTHTMRLGLPYSGGLGQNRTFVAGIYGTAITGGVPVVIDANGQLGVAAPPTVGGVTPTSEAHGLTTDFVLAALQRQVEAERAAIAELRSTNAALQARLARLEALVPPGRK